MFHNIGVCWSFVFLTFRLGFHIVYGMPKCLSHPAITLSHIEPSQEQERERWRDMKHQIQSLFRHPVGITIPKKYQKNVLKRSEDFFLSSLKL